MTRGPPSLSRIVIAFVAGALCVLALQFLVSLRADTVSPLPGDLALEAGLDALSAAVAEAGDFVRAHPWSETDREGIEAYRHVLRALVVALESRGLTDPDFPTFREINARSKAGMDNADQRYLITHLRGDAVYRVWGTRGSSPRLDFTVYGDDDLSPSISTLSTEALGVGPDGRIENIIGGPEQPGNWLATTPGPLRLLVRQIHSDWSKERPGDLHIDRIDAARPRYPVLTRAEMQRRLRETADQFALGVRRWPEFGRTRFHALMPANTLAPPRDTGGEGGLAGRLMVGGHFELDEDEALVIHTWPSDAAGFERGLILIRYDGMPVAELPEEEHPVAERVAFDDLDRVLPAGTPRVDAETRAARIAARRRHVQQRYGY